MRYLTAGESHGRALVGILEGVPSGLELLPADIDRALERRKKGYGRGKRMKIEQDRVEILSGVRHGRTTGAPIALFIENRDHISWQHVMSVLPVEEPERGMRRRTRPRPGHADLAGAIKYGHRDVRDVLERSSARETAMRVAVGAVAKKLLQAVGIDVLGYVRALGGVWADGDPLAETWPAYEVAEEDRAAEDALRAALQALAAKTEASPVRTFDPAAEAAMIAAIDRAREAGDTLGGVVEVVAVGVPVGLGSHVHWDRKLDGRLAQAVMSIQAIKGVEIGLGFRAADVPGSAAHDEIFYAPGRGFFRRTNRAGGLEGGMTTGMPLVVRAAMKPIPTLYRPLRSVDLVTKAPEEASVERSDTTAVPAAAVVAEYVVAFELARALLETFPADRMAALVRAVAEHRAYARDF
ncbi:chorismate synthase [Hydrogenibacillus schlegelii]|uniref:Chorismate synthase n=1 Tax=Hydrogenibacillus schlegelii TaxID=1484 RepID=A0A132NCQ1_HYDSH|nr:chorismate synthase [Hydrogenibacillus schlegelii]KWX07352.1 chorismate synthase [Hydrogenibacillus schlegelii]MBT9282384.1 chorismate synthase [Hydrogenibacillus schlegelii]OAR05523.1 chorismate synthase [Hydrogenibacillus schlegelii]